jgi:hypothetical protein
VVAVIAGVVFERLRQRYLAARVATGTGAP